MRHPRQQAGMPSPPFHHGYAAAFADGRRLRDASGRRRVVAGRPDRHHHTKARALFGVVAVIVALTVASDGGALVVGAGLLAGLLLVAWMMLVAAAPVLMVGGIAVAVTKSRRPRPARFGAPGMAPLPMRPPAPPRPDLVWGQARRRFDALRSAYAAYECDAMAVLRLPALADVTVPSTARFIDAFAEAQALDTDVFPGGGHAQGFVAAVDRAERAWRAAREAAERIRLSALTPAERATVERVIKLLTTARDSDNDAERLAAYSRARSELAKLDKAGVIHVPLPATAALDAVSRGRLGA